MSYIEISTKYHRLSSLELAHMNEKCLIPSLSISKSLEGLFRVGGIDRRKVEFLKLQSRDSSFVVVFDPSSETILYRERRYLGKYRRPRVSWSLGTMPVDLISEIYEFLYDRILLFFCFDLLESDDIRIFYTQIVEKSMLDAGSDTVDVPGDELHKRNYLRGSPIY